MFKFYGGQNEKFTLSNMKFSNKRRHDVWIYQIESGYDQV